MQYFELQSWWGLSVQQWRYDEVSGLRYVHRDRTSSRRSLRTTLQVHTQDGRWVTVANDTGLFGLYGAFERDIWRRMREKGIPTERVSEGREQQ